MPRSLDNHSASLLAIIDSAILSGPGRQLAALLASLRAGGVDASVVTFLREGRAPSPLIAHLESRGVPVTVIAERGPVDRRTIAELRRLVRERRPTIIQTHSYKATALAWWLRRTGEEFRWVGCFHGATTENFKVRAYHKLDQLLLRGADRLVIMAESQRAGLGHAGARAQVINNAVIPPPRASGAPLPEWAVTANPPLIGYVGRLSPEKGVDLLLLALRGVTERRPDQQWTAIIAGDGPEREALAAQSVTLGISDKVRFVGQLADPWLLYRQEAVIVLPSRSEGLPNVLLEAIAADRPVVSTTVGAVASVIGNGRAARLVPPENVPALTAAIIESITTLEDSTAAADRATVREQYALANRVEAHLAVYRELGLTA
ncbi:MAG: glycosyltransferase [Gemmatimonadales bacterium]|nr:glycosyltransferase [Gemmatimonadales bacterium]MDZ4390632.1 glycosyltransferase [Gemmatimonadales bacterium]